MTIAAGFTCADGIILGADTEVTQADRGKVYERKIFEINANHGCYAAYCGDSYFVKDLVRQFREATRSLPAQECIEAVVDQYRSALAGESGKEPEQRSWAELLVSIRQNTQVGYKSLLFHLYGDRQIPVGRYAAIGIGDEFAHAMFAPSYKAEAKMERNSVALIRAIRKVKQSVSGCGGDSDILCVNDHSFNSGTWLKAEFIRQVEEDCGFLEETLKPLYELFPSALDNAELEKHVKSVVRTLKKRRMAKDRLKISSWL